jgi:hypothetical protein
MRRQGRQEREARYKGHQVGSTATHSQDYLLLASRLYRLSAEESKKSFNGNLSYYVFAAIPILLAALQALVVEYEFIIFSPKGRKPVDVNSNEFVEDYGIGGDLHNDLNDLIELRNENFTRRTHRAERKTTGRRISLASRRRVY